MLVLFVVVSPASACTIFNASKNGIVLVGNNEDHDDPDGMVLFEPASQGMYGNVTFGFSDGLPQGGMNDQGLFYDFYASGEIRACPLVKGQILPSGEIAQSEPSLQELLAMYAKYGMPSKKMLQTCATVEEAVAYFEQHYEGVFGYAYIMLADKTGASATITWNWDKRELAVRNKTGEYQVIGVGSKVVFDQMNEGRYEVSTDAFKDLLDKTSIDITTYSNIYDLNTGNVTVYQHRNFEQSIAFNLAVELAKGQQAYHLSELFPKSPQ
jgi:hypothetical protein